MPKCAQAIPGKKVEKTIIIKQKNHFFILRFLLNNIF